MQYFNILLPEANIAICMVCQGEYCNTIPEATIYYYIGGQTSYNISLYWRQVGILYQLLAISGKQFFLEFVITLRQKKIFFWIFNFSFLTQFPISQI